MLRADEGTQEPQEDLEEQGYKIGSLGNTCDLRKERNIKEIDENYRNDVDLIFDIVADTTTSWEPVRELTKRLIQYLKDNYELSDIEETFNTKE